VTLSIADGDLRQFVRPLTKLSMLGILIATVEVPLTFLVGRPLLILLYRREYADHVGLLALFVGIVGLSTIGSFLFCGFDGRANVSGPNPGLPRSNACCGGGVSSACSAFV
jgi:hypothetical protein